MPKAIEPSLPENDAVDSDEMDAIRTPRTPNGQPSSVHAYPIAIARRVPTPQPSSPQARVDGAEARVQRADGAARRSMIERDRGEAASSREAIDLGGPEAECGVRRGGSYTRGSGLWLWLCASPQGRCVRLGLRVLREQASARVTGSLPCAVVCLEGLLLDEPRVRVGTASEPRSDGGGAGRGNRADSTCAVRDDKNGLCWEG